MLRAAALIASLLAADVTVAAAQTSTRIRGTIESATEPDPTIESLDGQTVIVTLTPNLIAVAVSKDGEAKDGLTPPR